MRRYYPGITLFKLVGCLLVLAAHVVLHRYMGVLSSQQLRFLLLPLGIIVPCFYMTAGFLAYQGWTYAVSSSQYMKRYVVRISLVYGVFCMLFTAEQIVPALVQGGLGLSNLTLQIKILIAAIVINGPSVQLWFIPPLLFSIALCYWLLSRDRLKLAVILAVSGFMISLGFAGSLRSIFMGTVDAFIPIHSSMLQYTELLTYRYFGYGLPFVLLGMLYSKYEESIVKLPIRPLILCGTILSIAEMAILYNLAEWSLEYRLTISILPNTVVVFVGLLRVKSKMVQAYHPWIQLFSVVTFCGHILFMRLNLYLLRWDIQTMSVLQDVIFVILTLAECLALTQLLYKKRIPSVVYPPALNR